MLTRTASLEAISVSLSPRGAVWYGKDRGGRIPFEDAAMALSGVQQPGYAFLLWSLGHHEPEHALVVTRHLRAVFEGEGWGEKRLNAMLSLCVGELSEGWAARSESGRDDEERMRWIGVKKSTWYQRWAPRYDEMMDEARTQIAYAHAEIAQLER